MTEPPKIPLRRNGFSSPYNMPQISAWMALFATLLHFLLGITPILPLKATIPLTAFFLFLIGLVFIYGIRALVVDSMDVYLEQHLRGQRGGAVCKESGWKDRLYDFYNRPRSGVPPLAADAMKHCWLCDVQVVESSMHCKYCNKCVGKFDHHCMWLNTCVGERNYEDFFRVMLAIFAMQVFHLSTSLALCIDIFLDGPTTGRADSWGGSEFMVALLLAFMAFDAFSLLLLVQLVWFHLGLQREQITTYQYIIRDHQKKRERSKLQRELDNQRAAALQKAKTEGQWLMYCRLTWGDETRKYGCGDFCDPLKMPTEVNEDVGFATVLGTNGYHATTSDGDEEVAAYDGAGDDDDDDDDEPVVAEQALVSTDDMTTQREPPGVTFLALQGDDILAEPGAYRGGDGAGTEENGKAAPEENGQDTSPKHWEIPSADESQLEEQASGEEIPEVDVYVSDDDCPTDEAGSPKRLADVDSPP